MALGAPVISARIVLHVRPDKRAEFLSAVNALMDQALRRNGCVSCRLAADCSDADGYILTSEWEGSVQFDYFQQSKEMNVLRGMRGLLDAEPRSIVDEVQRRTDSPLRSTLDQ